MRFLTLFLVFVVCAVSRQTIFNVPSADITAKASVYLEHESQFRAWQPGRYWFGTDYLAVGLGSNTEADVTLYNTSIPASGNVTAGLGVRSVFPITKSPTEFKWTVGDQALTSFQGQGIGYWGYSHFSGRLPWAHTRLTAGVSTGTKQLFGKTTTHFIGGVEQPLGKTFSLIADWYSGNHSLGYLTSGTSINLPKQFTFYLGYQRPNSQKVGKSGLTIELSKLF
jgi:hypothetical protein